MQAVQEPSFAFERPRQVPVAVKGLFDRNAGAEFLVHRPVNRTHTANAYLFLDQKSVL